MNNIQTIIKAYEITEKYLGQGNVDLIDYIINGNKNVFTRKENARYMVIDLDYEQTKEDIDAALINSAITGLEHPTNVRELSNRIPGKIIEWARRETNEEPNNTLDELFSEIYANHFDSRQVYLSLREARTYTTPEYEKYSEEVASMIRILEEAKETLKEKGIIK